MKSRETGRIRDVVSGACGKFVTVVRRASRHRCGVRERGSDLQNSSANSTCGFCRVAASTRWAMHRLRPDGVPASKGFARGAPRGNLWVCKDSSKC